MLYVIYGSDIARGKDKARSLIDSLRAKRPDAAFVRMDADSWDASSLEGHLGGQGLFSNKYIVFLDRVSENADAKEALTGSGSSASGSRAGALLSAMKESPNIFIILEGKVLADMKKAFEKYADKAVLCEAKIAGGAGSASRWTSGETSAFAIGDAMGERNRLKAWAAYRQAIDAGTEPENIAGTLFWQAKSMVLAGNTGSPAASGLAPFVFNKSKRFAANYSVAEMKNLMSELVGAYHGAHRGQYDLELSIERILLAL